MKIQILSSFCLRSKTVLFLRGFVFVFETASYYVMQAGLKYKTPLPHPLEY